jgi:small GTP-binding protein
MQEEVLAPRVITLGDSGVGKTALIHRIKTGEFMEATTPTVGAGVTVVDLPFRNMKCSIQLWDTAGQELYRNIIPIYFKGAVFAIICFSMTDPKSFSNLNSWIAELRAHADPDIGMVLVGSKYDENASVSEEAARRYADDNQLKLFLVSSLTGQNVPLLLEHIALTLMDKRAIVNRPRFSLMDGGREKKSCC